MQQRTQSCVRTAGDIVSTALGIIQYWEGTPPRVLISVLLIQNIPRKKIYSLQEYFEPKYSSKEKPERATSEIAYATLWDSGVDYLPPARWPVGSPRPERLPMPRGRYSIRSVSNDGARWGGLRHVLELGWFGLGDVSSLDPKHSSKEKPERATF